MPEINLLSDWSKAPNTDFYLSTLKKNNCCLKRVHVLLNNKMEYCLLKLSIKQTILYYINKYILRKDYFLSLLHYHTKKIKTRCVNLISIKNTYYKKPETKNDFLMEIYDQDTMFIGNQSESSKTVFYDQNLALEKAKSLIQSGTKIGIMMGRNYDQTLPKVKDMTFISFDIETVPNTVRIPEDRIHITGDFNTLVENYYTNLCKMYKQKKKQYSPVDNIFSCLNNAFSIVILDRSTRKFFNISTAPLEEQQMHCDIHLLGRCLLKPTPDSMLLFEDDTLCRIQLLPRKKCQLYSEYVHPEITEILRYGNCLSVDPSMDEERILSRALNDILLERDISFYQSFFTVDNYLYKQNTQKSQSKELSGRGWIKLSNPKDIFWGVRIHLIGKLCGFLETKKKEVIEIDGKTKTISYTFPKHIPITTTKAYEKLSSDNKNFLRHSSIRAY